MKKLFSSARGRFIACVAVSNLLAGLLSLFVWAPLSARILPPEHPLAPWVPMLLAILLALPVSGFVSRLSARPLQQMLHATQAVARGDYTVRVDETAGGELGELLRSFNRMTAELGSTEMMRSDFISTFSHEFKTSSSRSAALRGGCAAAACAPRSRTNTSISSRPNRCACPAWPAASCCCPNTKRRTWWRTRPPVTWTNSCAPACCARKAAGPRAV